MRAVCPSRPTSTRETPEVLLTPESDAEGGLPGDPGFRFTVRPARPADATALWIVHGRAIRALAGAPYTKDQLEAWAARTRPESYLKPARSRLLIVAETATRTGPRIVGYGQLHVVEGTIEAVYVDPEYARRGVGAALVSALERECLTRGLPGLIVEASLNSIPFYRALGFVAKEVDQHPLAPGVGIACAVMEKRLTPAAPPRE
jgi:putative acetyltransferase